MTNVLRKLPPAAPRRPTRIHIPLEVPRRIPHRLRTDPTNGRASWYLAACSTDTEFRFMHPCHNNDVVYTAKDGWTRDDAETFHRYLMGWDTVTLT